MRALAAVVVAGLLFVAMGEPAAAARGQKVFLKDCTLTMSALGNRGLGTDFFVYDLGAECDEYVLRGISLVSNTGQKVSQGVAGNDQDADPDLEFAALQTINDSGFAYGTVNVYIPYRERCDRYRLYPSGALRFTESHPCRSASS
jgi:hypothetical protein